MRHLIVLIVMLSSLELVAQKEISKRIEFSLDAIDFLVQLEKHDTGFVVSTGNMGVYDGDNIDWSTLIAHVNENGDIKWEKLIQKNHPQDVYVSGRNNLLVKENHLFYSFINKFNNGNSRESYIYILSNEGEVIDSTSISSDRRFSNIKSIESFNNKIIISFLIDYNKIKIILIDKGLNILKEKKITVPTQIGRSYLNVIDSCTVAFAFSEVIDHEIEYNLHLYDENLILQDSMQRFKTEIPLIYSLVNAVPTSDNGFIGTYAQDVGLKIDTFNYPASIFKLDSSLNVEWEHVFVHQSAKELNNIRNIGNGLYFGVGAADYFSTKGLPEASDHTYEGWAFLINEEGEVQWERHIFDTRYRFENMFFDGLKTENGFTIVGRLDTMYDDPDPYLNDIGSWFLTLDEKGCWNGNCDRYILINCDSTSYSYNPTSNVDKVMKGNLSIYPNPSNGILRVKLKAVGKKLLKIYDLKGRVVYEQNLYARESILNLTNLSAGTYVIKIKDTDSKLLYTQKVFIKGY